MALKNSVEVYGIRETLAEIREVDKNLFFAIRAFMKRAGDTLGNRVIGNSPLLAPTRGLGTRVAQLGNLALSKPRSVVVTPKKVLLVLRHCFGSSSAESD